MSVAYCQASSEVDLSVERVSHTEATPPLSRREVVVVEEAYGKCRPHGPLRPQVLKPSRRGNRGVAVCRVLLLLLGFFTRSQSGYGWVGNGSAGREQT
jgi:hypothetical protein